MIARVRAADNEAYKSQLAYLQGPEEYLAHIQATTQESVDRLHNIWEKYHERPDPSTGS